MSLKINPDELELRLALEPHWYRYEVESDEHDARLVCIPLTIRQYTPKGVRLVMGNRLVLKDYTHRGRAYAAFSPAQAKEDFRLRKLFQIRRLKSELAWAEQQLELVASQVKLKLG